MVRWMEGDETLRQEVGKGLVFDGDDARELLYVCTQGIISNGVVLIVFV